MPFPYVPTQCVGTLKDPLCLAVRRFSPAFRYLLSPPSVGTGPEVAPPKVRSSPRLEVVIRGAYIDRVLQRLIQCNS